MSAKDEKVRLRAVVHGDVQGVSFRAYTIMYAQGHDLTGWVRNRPDGTVEVLAEGSADLLDALEEWLHRGSPAARVTGVESERADATGEFSSFEVRYALG